MVRRSRLIGTTVFALAVALSLPKTSHADDDQEGLPPTPTTPSGTSPGVTPDSSLVRGDSTTSTTSLTSATYEPVAPSGVDRAERRGGPNRALLLTGGGIFVGTYAASAIVSGFSETRGDEYLVIPVVGPWLDLSHRDCDFGECGSREDFYLANILGSGLAQATGLALIATSFIVGDRSTPEERTKGAVRIVPATVGRGGAGLSALGSF